MEKFLRSNNFARALALFLAVALWLFVTGDRITRTTPSRKVIHGVPITYENLEQGFAVVDMPATVDITLEGLSEAFDTMTEPEAYLDLAEKGAGSHQVRVRVKPPRGLSLVSFSPEQVEVVIEPLQSVLFTVHVEFYGTPAPGWVKQSFTYEPMQVRLEAAQSVFGLIDRIVLRVDLNGAREQLQAELTPSVLSTRGEEMTGVSVTPGKVAVSVTLGRSEDSSP